MDFKTAIASALSGAVRPAGRELAGWLETTAARLSWATMRFLALSWPKNAQKAPNVIASELAGSLRFGRGRIFRRRCGRVRELHAR